MQSNEISLFLKTNVFENAKSKEKATLLYSAEN